MNAFQKKPTFLNYVIQITFIFLFNIVVLQLFRMIDTSSVIWAVGSGSLAASSCIVFAKPSAVSAHPLRLLAAYCLAILSGTLLHFIGTVVCAHAAQCAIMTVFAGLAVCIALISMFLLRLEHPPALGMALVLALELQDYDASLIVLLAVAILVIFRFLFGSFLRDLYS
ncbi:MAG: HPP family protein [Coxiellaceae bacterium]|nr:HPP family protein [Coxiellaceae bacterium]